MIGGTIKLQPNHWKLIVKEVCFVSCHTMAIKNRLKSQRKHFLHIKSYMFNANRLSSKLPAKFDEVGPRAR